MFNKKLVLNLMAAALVATLAGCGSSPAAPDPGDMGSDPSSTGAGGYGDPSAGGAAGGYGAPPTGVPGAGQYGTAGAATASLADLTATVTKKKNGVFLGMGAYKCTVEVSNPNSVARTGTLTVTFKNGSKNSKTAPITQQVSLGPNETKDFDFQDKKWSTDNVDVEITSDPAQGAAGATAGYGAPATGGAYGAPAGGGYGAPAGGGYGAPAGGGYGAPAGGGYGAPAGGSPTGY